jgi:hypothetical protein
MALQRGEWRDGTAEGRVEQRGFCSTRRNALMHFRFCEDILSSLTSLQCETGCMRECEDIFLEIGRIVT